MTTSQCDHIRQFQAAYPWPQKLPCAQVGCPASRDEWTCTTNRHYIEDGVGYSYEYHRELRDGQYSWELKRIERYRLLSEAGKPMMPVRPGTPMVRL